MLCVTRPPRRQGIPAATLWLMVLGAAVTGSSTPLWVSFLSPSVAVAAALYSWKTHMESRRTDRRDLFLKLHESLLAPELVKARRELYAISSEDDVRRLHESEEASLARIYRLLAMYDLFALYGKEKWVDKETILRQWGHSLAHSYRPAELVRNHRADEYNRPSWPSFAELAREAADRSESADGKANPA